MPAAADGGNRGGEGRRRPTDEESKHLARDGAEGPGGSQGRPAHPTVSVVVPVFNGGTDLRRCLESIRHCTPPPDEVIVVDDASTDGSHEVAQAMGATCLRLEEQRGPAHARNRGAEWASGEILFFVDADVELAADAVAEVLHAFAHESGLAAVFGSYDDRPAAPNFLSQYKNLLHHFVHQSSEERAWTFWAGCGAVRRDVFLSIGGFDEDYRRPSIEDIELGGRLRQAGHEIRLRKSLQGKHLKRWTPLSLLRADIRDRAVPWASLLSRQGGLVNDLNLRWPSRVSAAAAGILVTLAAAAILWPRLWILVALVAGLLVVLNLPLYAFFRRQRGLPFALGCIAWHWLYYVYSGAVFVAVYGAGIRPLTGGRGEPRR